MAPHVVTPARFATRHGPVAAEQIGCGPPLVLIHGNTMTAASQRRLAQRLAVHGQVTSIDLLGHGGSARPAGLFSRAYIQWQGEAVADILAQHDASVVLVGMSVGGMAAANAALMHPGRVRALVLDGIVRFVDDAIVATHRRQLAGLAPEWHRTMQRAHGADWWPMLADGVIAAMAALAASHADAIPGLETLATPVLLCQGGADPFCPPEHHAAIAAALPRARQVCCATAGHLLAWHAAPAFDASVAALLADHS